MKNFKNRYLLGASIMYTFDVENKPRRVKRKTIKQENDLLNQEYNQLLEIHRAHKRLH